MVDKNIGYIKLTRFSATTISEFKKAVEKLKSDGMKKLILDLQDNSGGYLNVAVELADQFLDENKMIVYTEGVNNPKFEYKTSSKGIFRKGEMVVLVDENSASASEIISGAIQDWDRGLIIGRRTFGKGLVQRPFNLSDGSMIRLTIAKYYTPTGRLIQKPYKNGYSDYSKDLIHRYNNGELTHADSTHFPDSLKKETLIYKRAVYGGGGIMPDIFVPFDTSYYSDWYRKISRQNIIYKFVLSYIDNNRAELKQKYKDFKTFYDKFDVSDEMLENLLKDGEKSQIKRNDKDFSTSKDFIKMIIKSYMAGDLFTNTEKFRILNENSHEFNKAVEVLKDKSLYYKKLNNIR
jgi:carboxyl-terminal processing protease